MITQEVKKLWFGDESHGKPKVTLRSLWVDKAIKEKQDMKVVYGDRYMILTSRELKKPAGERFFKSKIGKEDYSLLDYYWNPVVEESVRIPSDVQSRLKDIWQEKLQEKI